MLSGFMPEFLPMPYEFKITSAKKRLERFEDEVARLQRGTITNPPIVVKTDLLSYGAWQNLTRLVSCSPKDIQDWS